MKSPQDPEEDKNSSAKSIEELVHLLLKLHAKLKEKASPRRNRDRLPGQTDIVILILNQPEDRPRRRKAAAAPQPELPDGAWIEDLFAEIEARASKQRKNP
jgi:hypothetical protein